jgi:hypothetical protein
MSEDSSTHHIFTKTDEVMARHLSSFLASAVQRLFLQKLYQLHRDRQLSLLALCSRLQLQTSYVELYQTITKTREVAKIFDF